VPRLVPVASGPAGARPEEVRWPGPKASAPWPEPRAQADWPELRVRVRLSPGAQPPDVRRGRLAQQRGRRGVVGLLDAVGLPAAKAVQRVQLTQVLRLWVARGP
jgi:hypothetical protein